MHLQISEVAMTPSTAALALVDYRSRAIVSLSGANRSRHGLSRHGMRPREEYRDGWHVAGIEMVHDMPDDVVTAMHLDQRSAVVALTHDPKLDDLALMEALKSDAFYVGAIGSRANNAKRRERLKEFDLNDAQLARLHGPIGMYIGSKTPAEIAISILAEITAVKTACICPTKSWSKSKGQGAFKCQRLGLRAGGAGLTPAGYFLMVTIFWVVIFTFSDSSREIA